MSLIIAGSTSGTITLDTPAVAGTQTATLPAATGTVMVSGNMPAFSASNSGTQSIGNATFTKMLFDTVQFDTNSNFSSSRFTPTVAGYYQITVFSANNTGSSTGFTEITIYKNGSLNKQTLYQPSVNGPTNIITALIQMNGTTDYLEAYYYQNSGGTQSLSSGLSTHFSAFLVRSL